MQHQSRTAVFVPSPTVAQVVPARPAYRLKSRLRSLHLWLGLPLAAFLFIVGITGALLAFREPLDRMLNPNLARVSPAGTRLSLDVLAQKLQQGFPGYTAGQFNLPETADAALDVLLYVPGQRRPQAIAVNPYTGQILGNWDNSNHFMDRVLDLHKTLLLGGGGEGVVKLLALSLLILTVSGAILGLRRRRYFRQGSLQLSCLDWHSALGLFSAVFLVISLLTAIMPVPWSAVSRLLGKVPEPEHAPAARVLPPAQLLDCAQVAVPGATPTWLDLMWQPAHGGCVVAFRYPGDASLMGQTHVHLDPYSGRVLKVSTPANQPFLVNWTMTWKRELHTGTLFGWHSRLVACLTGLGLAVLAFTGPLSWWRRKQNRLAQTASSE